MNAVIYLRSATNDYDALKTQRAICHQLAKELGATIEAEFIDCGVSGRAADGPGLRALLEHIEKTHTDLVIMTHGYRLARKMDLYLELVKQIGKLGATVITQDKHVYIFGGDQS